MMLYSQDGDYLIDTKNFVLKRIQSFGPQKYCIVATSLSSPSIEIIMGEYDTRNKSNDALKSLAHSDPFGLLEEDF